MCNKQTRVIRKYNRALKKQARRLEKERKRKAALRAAENGIDIYKNFGVDL